MKGNHKYILILISIMIAGLILGLYPLSTPAVYHGSDPGKFSATKAAQHLEVIASKPHSILDLDAHEEVYQYVKAQAARFSP